MNITVKRVDCNNIRCIGELTMPDFMCHTLEDAQRLTKVMGQTAIPKGTYEVVVNYSNRFKKMLPLLIDVPNFSGVRIHSGNTEADTEGCILLGMERAADSVINSRAAMSRFMPILMKWLKREKVYLVVS